MSKPTANWEKVGDKFYRKVQLYTAVFDPDLELDKCRVVGAPFGGAVGTTPISLRTAEHFYQAISSGVYLRKAP